MDLGQWCESLLAAPTASAHSESDTPRANPDAVLPVQSLTSGEEEFVSDAAPAEVIHIDGRDEVIEVDDGDPGCTPSDWGRAVPSSMYARPRVFSLWQCRYVAWQPHLIMPLAAFRDSLGPQTKAAIMASLASGAQPEHLFQTVTNIMSKVLFTCDPKQAAFQFARSQGFTSDHHFVDGRPLAEHGAGPCANHAFRHCSVLTSHNLDMLVAGISCKPYSMARTGRFELGAAMHEEAFLMDTFFAILIRHQFKKGILENVFGFLLPESKLVKVSPYQRLLERARTETPNYHVTCYITDAKLFLVFHRRRVWIVFTRLDCGGEASAALQTRMIKAVVLFRYRGNYKFETQHQTSE